MKLLLVEGQFQMRSYLHRGLTESGFVVDTAEDGAAGLHLALIEDSAVAILNIILAKKDGQSVIRDLRASGKPTPAVFLTTHDFVPGNKKDLNLGAHDYLMKPFAHLHSRSFLLGWNRSCGVDPSSSPRYCESPILRSICCGTG